MEKNYKTYQQNVKDYWKYSESYQKVQSNNNTV